MQDAAGPVYWVDETFRGMSRVVGRPVPVAFRGLARRVLEFPSAYADLYALSELSGVSPGALKARFRRRGLASPSVYLRWLRILAAGHLLSEPGATTLSASYRLGISSDGNFCRWLRGATGLRPRDVKGAEGMTRLLVAFGMRLLDAPACEAWASLDDLFLRRVA
jgi:AraC-like DNA-binding protein